MNRVVIASAALAAIVPAFAAVAAPVQIRVSVENLAPANSVSFAPLRVGFHDGTFDSFDVGVAATAPIISIAEGGSGSEWFPFFAAQQPSGVSGTVGMGALLPGATATATFDIDPAVSGRFFSFGSMVVPSNDYFIGNDSGMQYALFDAQGNFQPRTILQSASDIWDAGSETTDAANAAFLVGGVNGQRVAENGVVGFDFADLGAFNGLTTAAGYIFDLQLTAQTAVYRINIELVPAPGAIGIASLGLLAAARRRRTA
jgi:hypothetical protein